MSVDGEGNEWVDGMVGPFAAGWSSSCMWCPQGAAGEGWHHSPANVLGASEGELTARLAAHLLEVHGIADPLIGDPLAALKAARLGLLSGSERLELDAALERLDLEAIPEVKVAALEVLAGDAPPPPDPMTAPFVGEPALEIPAGESVTDLFGEVGPDRAGSPGEGPGSPA